MSSAKRKATDTAASQIPTKRLKKSPKKKGKEKESEFQVIRASLLISIPPVFASNPRSGVEEMLDSMVMRYIPALQGVVLSHSNIEFVRDTANIKDDCPFLVCNIAFDATVWSPQVKMILGGRINLSSPDHISLLVHKTFNVSIPRHHIPTDQWEFEYGPAENDPEYGPDAQEDEETSGRWINKINGQKLGGEEGYLQFTVIGLTVANEMLSLVGSLQHDPFSPRHVPVPTKPTEDTDATQDETVVDEDVRELDASDDEEDLMDTFRALGKQTDNAIQAAANLSVKEKKRKGKTDGEKKKKKKKS